MLIGGTEMSPQTRTAIFVVLAIGLLVIYFLQVKGFSTQAGIWIAIILIGGGFSFYSESPITNTVLLVLIGISGGMVLSNAKIGLT
jgi:hypothetical protein